MTDKPATSFSVMAARLSFLSAFLFIALLFLLHFAKPELDPSWRFISEYQLGDFGWMMFLAFLFLALSSVSLGIALWPRLRNIGGRVGLIMLFITALGMVMAAFFETDPLNTKVESFHGKIHQLGATFDMIPFAALFISFNLIRKNESWRNIQWKLILSTGLIWIAEIAFITSIVIFFPADGEFGPDVPVGWPGRISIALQSAWLMIIAWQVIKFHSRPAHAS